jgi:hypothetical protein
MGRYLFLFTVFALFATSLTIREHLDVRSPWRVDFPAVRRFAAAFLLAFCLTSLVPVWSHAGGNLASWDFESSLHGWRAAFDTRIARVRGTVGAESPGTIASILSPPSLNLDGELNTVIRVAVRGPQSRTPGTVTLNWTRPGRGYSGARAVSETVRWTGTLQTVTFRTAWSGTIDGLRLDFHSSLDQKHPAAFFIQSVQAEGRALSVLSHALRWHAASPWLLFITGAALLSLFGLIRNVRDAHTALPALAGCIVLVVWLLADAVPGFSFPLADGRPIRLVADVRKAWNELAPLSPWERLKFLERQAGRPDLGAAIERVRDGCAADRSVAVLAPQDLPSARYGGHLYQRLGYLLFPRKVRVTHDPGQLRHLLDGNADVGGIIGYGVPVPSWVEAKKVHQVSETVQVYCEPRDR